MDQMSITFGGQEFVERFVHQVFVDVNEVRVPSERCQVLPMIVERGSRLGEQRGIMRTVDGAE
jgi:hypothetical protein